MPSVSVIIPVFNGRSYIRRALVSVLQQAVLPAEILVVDDGSTDGSRDSVADLIPHVRWLQHEKNRGISAARNTGIRAAKGEFVAFLDADDWWRSERLQVQIAVHERHPHVGLSFCDFVQVSQTGLPERWQGGLHGECKARGIGMARLDERTYALSSDALWALVRYTSFIHPSTVICRRAVFDQSGNFDEALHGAEDLDMWFRLAANCNLALVDSSLVVVENRPDSLGRSTAKMSHGMLAAYARILARYPDMPKDVRRAAERHQAHHHLSLAWLARGSGEWRETRRRAFASLAAFPTAPAMVLAIRASLMSVLPPSSSGMRAPVRRGGGDFET